MEEILKELKEIIAAYECEPCEEEARLAMATGRLASLAADDAFAPEMLAPPKEWFEDVPPEAADLPLKKIYVADDGRVFGRVHDNSTCILDGSKDCWKPDKQDSYDLTYQGVTETAEGELITTADLAITEGHAPVAFWDDWQMSLAFNMGDIDERGQAVDDPAKASSKLARVRFVDREDGLWALGAVYPTATAKTVVLARGSSWSGHWQTVPRQGMKFLGAVVVNRPGLPQLSRIAMNNGYAIVPEGTEVIHMAAIETPTQESDITSLNETSQKMPDITELISRVSALEEAQDVTNERLKEHEQLITSSALEDIQIEELTEAVEDMVAKTESDRNKEQETDSETV